MSPSKADILSSVVLIVLGILITQFFTNREQRTQEEELEFTI